MLLYYVDECGDHSMTTAPDDARSLKKGTSTHFVLAGLGVRDSSRRPLAQQLFELKKKHFGEAAESLPWGETEIKGRHLFRTARSAASGNASDLSAGYRSLDTVVKVHALARDLGLVLTSFRPNIFVTIVDKQELLQKRQQHHPVALAYAYMHQRVALSMENLYAGDAAIFVADQQTQHEKLFRAGEFKRTRGALSHKLPRQPDYDLVLDKPLWVDTALSSWDREIIQLADVAAYSVYECLRRGEAPTDPVYLWPQLSSCMASHFTTGEIAGAGVSIYPRSARMPQLGMKKPAQSAQPTGSQKAELAPVHPV